VGRGKLDDHGALREIEVERGIWGVGVQGEADVLWLAVQRAEDFVWDDSELCVAFEDGGARDRGVEEFVGLDGAVEVAVVVCLLCGVGGWEAKLEGITGARGCCGFLIGSLLLLLASGQESG
jgi:hypothetical protein